MIIPTQTSSTSRGVPARRLLQAGALLATVLAFGCTASDRTEDGSTTKDSGHSCGAPADSCTRNADCCEGTCTGGKCSALCAAVGATCAANKDCCEGTCASGKCQALCGASGDSCSKNADCCEGTCASGKCKALCSDKGDSCSKNADCCEGVCSEGTCGDPTPQCANLNQSCSASTPCCAGEGVCTAGTCQNPPPTKKKVTEVCGQNSDCVSNFCGQWEGSAGMVCSERCATSSGCVADSATGAVACVGSVDAACYRTCNTSSDCSYISSDWTCDTAKTVEGVVTGICGYWVDLGIAYACRENRQCASGVCNGSWCTKICSTDNDCATDGSAVCLGNTAGSNTCFPVCNATADCSVYGTGLTCQAATSLSGTNASVCSG